MDGVSVLSIFTFGSRRCLCTRPLLLQELLHEALEQARRLPDDLVMLDCPLKDSMHF